MREMVAKEIAAFRERSNRRDMERMKREEEVERMERERNHAPRMSRLASPPLSAPTGPSGGSNSIPIGPSRHREVPTAPSRMVKGVSFVNGTTNNNNSSTLPSNTSTSSYWTREEEDSSASDSELESRRRKKKSHDLESAFLDHERRWLNRERSRTSALERETQRDREDEARAKLEVESMATRLANWDDTVEAARKLEDYYVDRSLWIRNRTLFRQREIEMDERDRAMEIRQQEQEKKHAAESMADSFLARQAEELETRTHPSSSSNTTTAPHNTTNNPAQPKFKLALSAAIKKTVGADAPNKHGGRRTTTTDVENLLEDEEEDESKTKRVLVPIQYDDDANGSGGGIGAVDEETREQLVRQLAQEIPSDKKGLFEWKVQWEFLDEQMVGEKLKPFVEKKIVEVTSFYSALSSIVRYTY